MKKIASTVLLLSILITLFAPVGQAAGQAVSQAPKLFLDGVELKPLVNPKIINERTLVPVRVLSESLGYDISWDNPTRSVTIEGDTQLIRLVIDNNIAMVNDHFVEMDTQAILENGTTLVPIRFIGEQFGLTFEWNQEKREVHMFKPENAEPETIAATIKGIGYNNMNELIILHDGDLKLDRSFYLSNPTRVVFDFKDAAYTSELAATFVSGESKTTLEGHPFMNSFRYSQFQKTPSIARLVLDVTENVGYKLDSEPGLTRLTLISEEDTDTEPGVTIPEDSDSSSENGNGNGNGNEPEKPVVTDPNAGKKYHIVIDAGHGGTDPGAASVNKKYEKEFNLNVALKVKALLEKEPLLVPHLTRETDVFIALNDRVQFAEDLGADLFVSIHANSILNNSSVNGTETYYSRADSKPFADVMHKHILGATKLKDRYVKQADFRVIKSTTMPAILLEVGFLSNANDANTLFKAETQDRIAAAIVAGIKEYLKLS